MDCSNWTDDSRAIHYGRQQLYSAGGFRVSLWILSEEASDSPGRSTAREEGSSGFEATPEQIAAFAEMLTSVSGEAQAPEEPGWCNFVSAPRSAS